MKRILLIFYIFIQSFTNITFGNSSTLYYVSRENFSKIADVISGFHLFIQVKRRL